MRAHWLLFVLSSAANATLLNPCSTGALTPSDAASNDTIDSFVADPKENWFTLTLFGTAKSNGTIAPHPSLNLSEDSHNGPAPVADLPLPPIPIDAPLTASDHTLEGASTLSRSAEGNGTTEPHPSLSLSEDSNNGPALVFDMPLLPTPYAALTDAYDHTRQGAVGSDPMHTQNGNAGTTSCPSHAFTDNNYFTANTMKSMTNAFGMMTAALAAGTAVTQNPSRHPGPISRLALIMLGLHQAQAGPHREQRASTRRTGAAHALVEPEDNGAGTGIAQPSAPADDQPHPEPEAMDTDDVLDYAEADDPIDEHVLDIPVSHEDATAPQADANEPAMAKNAEARSTLEHARPSTELSCPSPYPPPEPSGWTTSAHGGTPSGHRPCMTSSSSESTHSKSTKRNSTPSRHCTRSSSRTRQTPSNSLSLHRRYRAKKQKLLQPRCRCCCRPRA